MDEQGVEPRVVLALGLSPGDNRVSCRILFPMRTRTGVPSGLMHRFYS